MIQLDEQAMEQIRIDYFGPVWSPRSVMFSSEGKLSGIGSQFTQEDLFACENQDLTGRHPDDVREHNEALRRLRRECGFTKDAKEITIQS